MKKTALHSAVYAALYYGTNAVYQGYASKFYQQQGMGERSLVVLLVSFPLFSMLTQPLWGRWADRLQDRRWALTLALLLSALTLPLLYLGRGFGFFLAVSGAFALCYPAVQPLGDSVILHGLQKEGASYGPVRLCGTLAYAAANLLTGPWLRDDYRPVPLIVSIGLAAQLAAAFFLPKTSHMASEKRRRSVIRELLRLPHIRPLLALYMLLQLALGAFFSYYSLYFTSLPGGSSRLLGYGYFAATLSEVPFLLLSERLFRRFGAGRLMLASALSLSLRFLLIGLSRRLEVQLASQLLHGLGFIVIQFCMAQYISRTVPENLRASGQTLLAVCGFGIARVVGVLAGGILSRTLGSAGGFLCMAGLCLAACGLFALHFLRLPPLNGDASSKN